MTRHEHLAWAKTRALEYVDLGRAEDAFRSFTSDLLKFDGRMYETEQFRFMMQEGQSILLNGSDPERMRRWIEGCN